MNRYVRDGVLATEVSTKAIHENLRRLEREAEGRFSSVFKLAQVAGLHAQPNGRSAQRNLPYIKRAITKLGGINNAYKWVINHFATFDHHADKSDGAARVFKIFQEQGTWANKLLSTYERLTDPVRQFIGGPNAKERHLANMMLAYLSMNRHMDVEARMGFSRELGEPGSFLC